jgi:arabinose-5-phosphate isomerase
MTRNFQTVVSDSLLPEALQLLAERKISELPVVTPGQQPLGIIDITDVMSVLAKPWQEDDQRSTVKPKIYSYAEFQQAQPKSR